MGEVTPAKPAYQQLADELRRRIVEGRYRDGVRLPTESELSQEFDLSRQTVRRAFLELVGEGAVYRVPGRGTFVAENDGRYLRQLGSIEDLLGLSADTQMAVLEAPSRQIDINAAGRLKLETDAVYGMVFLRLHDGSPFGMTTAWWPEPIARLVVDAPELAEGAVGNHTVIGLLEPQLTVPINECSQSITATVADPAIADALSCPVGHPILQVDRLYSDAAGEAVELAVSRFLPEQYTYRVTLRRHAG